jgi:TrmH family RNA methyltransferase
LSLNGRVVLSTHNQTVKYLISIREDRAFRCKEQKALIIGKKMVQELEDARVPLLLLILLQGESPPKIPAQDIIFVSFEVLRKITGVPSPEPWAALISMPRHMLPSVFSHLLVLDGISDPGNVGTLIRSALALGWDGVYLLENSCDPYNEKALRAAKGATLRLPWQEGSWKGLLTLLKQSGTLLFVADKEGTPLEQVKVEKDTPMALLLSRESCGVRDGIDPSFERITIPMQKNMESLNVASAGAILLYHLKLGRFLSP